MALSVARIVLSESESLAPTPAAVQAPQPRWKSAVAIAAALLLGATLVRCGSAASHAGEVRAASDTLFVQPVRAADRRLVLRSLSEFDAHALPGSEEAHGPQLLLDGAALLFTIAKVADGATRWDTAQVVVQTLASGGRKTVVSGGSDARYFPTGHLVYAVGGIVFAVPFDAARQAVTGQPVPVVEGVRRTPGPFSGATQLATSSTGTLVYVPGPTVTTTAELAIALADRTGALTRLAVPPGPYVHVRASRDGVRLAVGTDDGREATVWIHEVAGESAMRRLTFRGQNRVSDLVARRPAHRVPLGPRR